jgi:hypothetical protein
MGARSCTPETGRSFRLSFGTGVPLRIHRGLDFRAHRLPAHKIVAGFARGFAMKRAAVVFLVLAALACIRAADIKGMGTLAGTVVGASGKAVADARVTSQGADGTKPQSTTTNAEGRFFFPELKNGYYDVRAYHNGAWTDWKHNIEVKTGKQTEVKLQLPAPAKKSK